jgi:hypothetical protein
LRLFVFLQTLVDVLPGLCTPSLPCVAVDAFRSRSRTPNDGALSTRTRASR